MNNPAGMKVIVQNAVTQEYFVGGTVWSNDPALALNFEMAARAAKFCEGREHVRIIMKFEGARPDWVLPAGKPVSGPWPAQGVQSQASQ